MAEYTKDEAIDKLNELMSRYGGDRIFRLYTGRDSPLKEPITPDEFERLQDIGDALDDGEIGRITGNRIEETQEGMAEMQEAAMSQDALTRRVSVEGQPGDRKYNFDDGADSRKRYIPPSAFMDAINAVEDELGDANQYVASGDAGTVVFSVGDGFQRYEFQRPERDDRYPFDDQLNGGQQDSVETNLGSLEPETFDPAEDTDDSPQRSTQGTLGGDSALDPGEFPTEPDAAAKRQREQLRREEQQESLEGDAPEFDPAAEREAQQQRERQAERLADEIAENQADLTGDRVDDEDIRPSPDDDDDQQGLASFVNDSDNGGGSGN